MGELFARRRGGWGPEVNLGEFRRKRPLPNGIGGGGKGGTGAAGLSSRRMSHVGRPGLEGSIGMQEGPSDQGLGLPPDQGVGTPVHGECSRGSSGPRKPGHPG